MAFSFLSSPDIIKTVNNNKIFHSPTYGRLSFSKVISKIKAYIRQKPEFLHRIIIGCDSQTKNGQKSVDFVTAVVIHRVGAGGIYFWKREEKQQKYALRQRIYEEALMSLSLAQKFIEYFPNQDIEPQNVEIHVDIGPKGETRTMINEVVGMIRANGFNVKTKPQAFGASSVADKHV